MDSSLKEDCSQITTSVDESQVQGSTQLVTPPAADTSSVSDSSQSPALLEAGLPPVLKLVSNPKANGIMYSGTFLGGTVMPFIIEVLLNKFGLRVAFASLATVYAILIASVLPFVKSRIPPSTMTAPDTPDWSFLRNPKFIILVSGNFLQGLGNFIPPLWLPTFATDLNMSATTGTLVVSLMNGTLPAVYCAPATLIPLNSVGDPRMYYFRSSRR
ncbi:hypothetical protein FS749_007008 [Ceratobasidium sp. UAMH 11750]|nr:hypothetical protein FS749_007008 [Ceratobasidium sp. UAMH 11750]